MIFLIYFFPIKGNFSVKVQKLLAMKKASKKAKISLLVTCNHFDFPFCNLAFNHILKMSFEEYLLLSLILSNLINQLQSTLSDLNSVEGHKDFQITKISNYKDSN